MRLLDSSTLSPSPPPPPRSPSPLATPRRTPTPFDEDLPPEKERPLQEEHHEDLRLQQQEPPPAQRHQLDEDEEDEDDDASLLRDHSEFEGSETDSTSGNPGRRKESFENRRKRFMRTAQVSKVA